MKIEATDRPVLNESGMWKGSVSPRRPRPQAPRAAGRLYLRSSVEPFITRPASCISCAAGRPGSADPRRGAERPCARAGDRASGHGRGPRSSPSTLAVSSRDGWTDKLDALSAAGVLASCPCPRHRSTPSKRTASAASFPTSPRVGRPGRAAAPAARVDGRRARLRRARDVGARRARVRRGRAVHARRRRRRRALQPQPPDPLRRGGCRRAEGRGGGALARPASTGASRCWRCRARISGPRRTCRELVGGADVVVVAADRPPYMLARWVNAACIDARRSVRARRPVPRRSSRSVRSTGPVAQRASPVTSARCGDESPHYDEYVAHAQCATPRSATLGPASGLVGSALGMELLHLLTGTQPATLGAAVTDRHADAARRRSEEVPRAADCDACQHLGDGPRRRPTSRPASRSRVRCRIRCVAACSSSTTARRPARAALHGASMRR